MRSFRKEYDGLAEAIMTNAVVVPAVELEVYCSDIDDYDILIGMDIITETDFLITNKDGKTTFQFFASKAA